MASKAKIFAGAMLKELRERHRLTQSSLAHRLGVSVSYLSQMEGDTRPLSVPVLIALSRDFALDLSELVNDDNARLAADLREALADPLFANAPAGMQEIKRSVAQTPGVARRFVSLYQAYRQQLDRLQTLDDAIGGQNADIPMLPWDEVRDYFHYRNNYIAELDLAAESLVDTLVGEAQSVAAAIERLLQERCGISVTALDEQRAAPDLRRFDVESGQVAIATGVPPETRNFLLAHQLALSVFSDELDALTAQAALRSDDARKLLRVGLANYAAGALLMPYEHFAQAARDERHDVERLAQKFAVSFEQVCHRLSTLQRPGARGLPFFFVRVDMAGNITKRHSATRLQFARYGGTCPLWNVHEAVAAPGRIFVQLVETADGVRYVSMARGLVKRAGRFQALDRRYAVALGCEASFARQFVYADGLAVDTAAATPIAASCRICPRVDCAQRAFPPADRRMVIDPNVRPTVPYEFR